MWSWWGAAVNDEVEHYISFQVRPLLGSLSHLVAPSALVLLRGHITGRLGGGLWNACPNTSQYYLLERWKPLRRNDKQIIWCASCFNNNENTGSSSVALSYHISPILLYYNVIMTWLSWDGLRLHFDMSAEETVIHIINFFLSALTQRTIISSPFFDVQQLLSICFNIKKVLKGCVDGCFLSYFIAKMSQIINTSILILSGVMFLQRGILMTAVHLPRLLCCIFKQAAYISHWHCQIT